MDSGATLKKEQKILEHIKMLASVSNTVLQLSQRTYYLFPYVYHRSFCIYLRIYNLPWVTNKRNNNNKNHLQNTAPTSIKPNSGLLA